MKKVLTLLLLLPLMAVSQDMYVAVVWRDANSNIIDENNKATVGDTITLDYMFVVNKTGVKYVTFDGQYNNDHVTPVEGTFSFDLSPMNDSSVIAERYVYDNKVWNQTTADCFDIQTERNAWLAGTSYADNQMFSIERIAIQASSGDIGSLDVKVFAQQDFIVQEPAVSAAGEYSFTLGEAEDVNGTSIGQFIPTKCTFDLSAKPPAEYQIIFEVELPSTINPTEMNGYFYSNEQINSPSGENNIDRQLDVSGKITLTDVVLDETYRLAVNPINATHIDDIITVTDAYRAFKGLNDVGIDGNDKILR